jgi:hypothetical protein
MRASHTTLIAAIAILAMPLLLMANGSSDENSAAEYVGLDDPITQAPTSSYESVPGEYFYGWLNSAIRPTLPETALEVKTSLSMHELCSVCFSGYLE